MGLGAAIDPVTPLLLVVKPIRFGQHIRSMLYFLGTSLDALAVVSARSHACWHRTGIVYTWPGPARYDGGPPSRGKASGSDGRVSCVYLSRSLSLWGRMNGAVLT